MPHLLKRLRHLSLTPLFFATLAHAAAATVDLSAEAHRPAANDLIFATVSVDASGATLGVLAKQLNAQIAEALKTAKSYPAVKTQSGGTQTYPNFAKNGKISSWRMRSDLTLESSDSAAMSGLLEKLQETLSISSLVSKPSSETRKKAEDEAIVEAIQAFEARAKVIASAMGKSAYRIKKLNVGANGNDVQPVMYRAGRMGSSAEAMPIEAGESIVSVTVAGQIEFD